MALILVVTALLVLALGLVQAWTLWYLRREVRRLDFRLAESLDDADLLDFQERIKGLLAEARQAATELTAALEGRRGSLEDSIQRARQAEKSLTAQWAQLAAAAPKAGGGKDEGAKDGGSAAGKPPFKDARAEKDEDKSKARRLLARSTGGPAAPRDAKLEGALKPELRPKPELKTRLEASAPAKIAAKADAKPADKPGLLTEAAPPTEIKTQPKAASKPVSAVPALNPGSVGAGSAMAGVPGDPALSRVAPGASGPTATPEGREARYQRIYELADQGLTVAAIARRSGVLAGEVDLILSLRRQGQGRERPAPPSPPR